MTTCRSAACASSSVSMRRHPVISVSTHASREDLELVQMGMSLRAAAGQIEAILQADT